MSSGRGGYFCYSNSSKDQGVDSQGISFIFPFGLQAICSFLYIYIYIFVCVHVATLDLLRVYTIQAIHIMCAYIYYIKFVESTY